MPWLTVVGTGQWGFTRQTGRPKLNARGEPVLDPKGTPYPEVELVNFKAGVHEVDEETAQHGRLARNPMVVVTDEQPTVIKRDPTGPMNWDDIRAPADGGIYIEEAAGEITQAPTDAQTSNVCPCLECPRLFPSPGALARHVEFDHAPVNSP